MHSKAVPRQGAAFFLRFHLSLSDAFADFRCDGQAAIDMLTL